MSKMNGDLIGLILSIVAIILFIIVLNIKIKECHDKGAKFVRGYCISNEVIK